MSWYKRMNKKANVGQSAMAQQIMSDLMNNTFSFDAVKEDSYKSLFENSSLADFPKLSKFIDNYINEGLASKDIYDFLNSWAFHDDTGATFHIVEDNWPDALDMSLKYMDEQFLEDQMMGDLTEEEELELDLRDMKRERAAREVTDSDIFYYLQDKAGRQVRPEDLDPDKVQLIEEMKFRDTDFSRRVMNVAKQYDLSIDPELDNAFKAFIQEIQQAKDPMGLQQKPQFDIPETPKLPAVNVDDIYDRDIDELLDMYNAGKISKEQLDQLIRG
jgi:hypothetical protein